MKKLALIMISAVIMTVFIAFNYLLWDRGRFEDLSESQNASINALGREISKLNNDIRLLELKLSELEESKRHLEQDRAKLEKEKNDALNILSIKRDMIGFLKVSADLKPAEEVVKKWVQYIDAGQYDEAYRLYSRSYINSEKSKSIYDFISEHKSTVKNMKLASVKINTENESESLKDEIVFRASIDVKKADNSTGSIFNEGINERYFIMMFDSENGGWFISDIITP